MVYILAKTCGFFTTTVENTIDFMVMVVFPIKDATVACGLAWLYYSSLMGKGKDGRKSSKYDNFDALIAKDFPKDTANAFSLNH